VNQLNAAGRKADSYDAFGDTSATATVNMPLIMDRNGGFLTGWSIMNVGSGPTTITVNCANSNKSVTKTFSSGSLQPYQAYTDVQGGVIAPGFVGSCVATAANPATDKIVGIVNELNPGSPGDYFMVYDGINN
jgi:hypothetical protein